MNTMKAKANKLQNANQIMHLILIAALTLFSFSGQAQNETAESKAARVPSSLVQISPQPLYYSPYAFVVDKKARTLTVWHQDGSNLTAVASFPADLGKREGD